EVSREAADLILLDDNFTTIVETVKDGRRIYDNIRKAVGYVLTIHIPIALSSLLAPMLGIAPNALLLLPLHVVLLELLIDPTCSIILERQPAESDIMDRGPRNPQEKLLTWGPLCKSALQGLAIFAASFGTYFAILDSDPVNAPIARSMGLTVIMLSNLFLVQVNSSAHDFALRSMIQLAKDKVMWAVNLGTLAMLTLILYTPLNGVLKLSPLSTHLFWTAVGISFAAVFWYELVKLARKLFKMHHIQRV
ncbi:MAG: cation-translocating P-type ATPase, partial [Oscillospiraceae bacterium]